jgi:hypothetical protein
MVGRNIVHRSGEGEVNRIRLLPRSGDVGTCQLDPAASSRVVLPSRRGAARLPPVVVTRPRSKGLVDALTGVFDDSNPSRSEHPNGLAWFPGHRSGSTAQRRDLTVGFADLPAGLLRDPHCTPGSTFRVCGRSERGKGPYAPFPARQRQSVGCPCSAPRIRPRMATSSSGPPFPVAESHSRESARLSGRRPSSAATDQADRRCHAPPRRGGGRDQRQGGGGKRDIILVTRRPGCAFNRMPVRHVWLLTKSRAAAPLFSARMTAARVQRSARAKQIDAAAIDDR